jgi:hypothetical protein
MQVASASIQLDHIDPREEKRGELEMAKLKLSGAAVLLIVVVPLFMYTGALLIGIQLGRALERRPDSGGVSFSIRGALAYLAKVTAACCSSSISCALCLIPCFFSSYQLIN